MTLSVAIANYNYGRTIARTIESALAFGDEVLVYDDASTDESWDIIQKYDVVSYRAPENHGQPMWAYDRSICEATGDYITFLDSDNYLTGRPPLSGDYCFGDIVLVDELNRFHGYWGYSQWPLDPQACLDIFRSERKTPLPSGGFWRRQWLIDHDLNVFGFAGTSWGYDMRMHIEWLQHDPKLVYLPDSCLNFMWHANQITQREDLAQIAAEELDSLGVSI